MPLRHGEPAVAPLPSPFPEGWYYVESRRAVQKAGLIQKTWMGENIVVWCDESGRACVAEAICPHLGSELGPDAGGRICEGRLVCPFHGFEFDTTGQCVATPYAPPPRSARLRVFHTREMHGLIFAWWGIDGRDPQWSLPDDPPDEGDWSAPQIRTTRFAGHPQETTENSVDIAHLRYVHGYDSVSRVDPLVIDGACLTSRFDFTTVRRIAKVGRLTLKVSANARIFGLGFSLVDIYEHTIGMDMRLWILATPVDGTDIDLTQVSQVREIRRPRRRIAGLGFLPTRWRAPVMSRFIVTRQQEDVEQDVVIWSRKEYLPRPRLNRADGEITAFRHYCAQFYP